MSSKLQVKTLLAKSNLSNEHSMISKNSQIYTSYEMQLESNIRTILKRYHNLDHAKVRNLLEELDNNLDLAIKILEEEMDSSNKILEERKVQGVKTLNLTQDQENQILKHSFLNLYKKFILVKKENEQLAKKNESCRQEIDRLKCMNKLLMEGQYSQISVGDSRDIY